MSYSALPSSEESNLHATPPPSSSPGAESGPKHSHDVVIVGAGPSGSLAALVLARAGHRVALLDRASFPRPKVCGNCINPSVWRIWKKLGLTDSFSALPHQEMAGFTIRSEDRFVYRHTFRPPHRGPRAVARHVLDDWLRREAEQSGAEFFPETTVTGIDPALGTISSSHGTFTGKLILGADGRNSLVARLCKLMPPPRRCHRVAWQATLAAPADLDDHVHMQIFEEGYYGYCRYSPTEAVVSIVLDSRRTQNPLHLARRYFPDLPEQSWLRMNPITRSPAAAMGSGRVWLVGDSARVVEPFTGEGISFALFTAMLAAESAAQGFKRQDLASAFRDYVGAHRRLYRRRVWVNTLVRLALVTPSRTVHLLRRVKPAPALVSFLSNRVHAS